MCVACRVLGFDHVSDDDFARVTIAQAFAHAPKLDPSGTSWLPFPFWLLGSVLFVSRSLAFARAASIVLASVAATLPYLALRREDVPRGTALFATAFAFVTPWAIWTGASTVPESITASLLVAGTIALTSEKPHWGFALAIAAACLSRYEPWPVAAVLALVLLVRKRPALAALCALGPLVWMAWNAYAHDGPLHFFRRVSNYKRAIGEGSTDTLTALVYYPWLLVKTRPEVTVAALAFLRWTPNRWRLPLACVLAQIAFLAIGNARDGAPAHHAERALLGALGVLAIFVGVMLPRKTLVLACIALLWVASFARDALAMPGSDDRAAIAARGASLPRDQTFTITPCAFEHFALIAGYGAPEAFTIAPADPHAEECPTVVPRGPSSPAPTPSSAP